MIGLEQIGLNLCLGLLFEAEASGTMASLVVPWGDLTGIGLSEFHVGE